MSECVMDQYYAESSCEVNLMALDAAVSCKKPLDEHVDSMARFLAFYGKPYRTATYLVCVTREEVRARHLMFAQLDSEYEEQKQRDYDARMSEFCGKIGRVVAQQYSFRPASYRGDTLYFHTHLAFDSSEVRYALSTLFMTRTISRLKVEYADYVGKAVECMPEVLSTLIVDYLA